MTTPDPDELLRQLDPGIAELKAKAELAQERIATSSATRQSSDRSVSVTVGPGGNLTGLNLTEHACQRPPAELAAQILQLAGQAQQQMGDEIMAAFSGLVGPDSTAMSVLTPFLPPRPDDEREDGQDGRPSAGDVEPDYDQGDLWK